MAASRLTVRRICGLKTAVIVLLLVVEILAISIPVEAAMTCTVYQYPGNGVTAVSVSAAGEPRAGEIVAFSCALTRSNNARIWFRTSRAINAQAQFTFDRLSVIEPGEYTLTVRALARNGETIYTNQQPFSRAAVPDWLNNTLGQNDTVPSPWTRVTVSGNSVNTWHRQYVFGNTGLPISLNSSGGNLLAMPMRLVAIVNGNSVTFVASRVIEITPGNTKTTVVAHSISDIYPDLALTITTAVEFDGFARVDLKLTGTADLTVSRFWLEIPMVRDNALFRLPIYNTDPTIGVEGYDAPVVGETYWPDAGAYVGEKPQIPPGTADPYSNRLYWVGGDDRGLIWAAESDKGWLLSDRWKAQTLSVSSDSVVWRIHFIDDLPRNMANPLALTYCFMATPVKPVTDWYSIRHGQGAAEYSFLSGTNHIGLQKASEIGLKSTGIHEHWTEIMGYPGTFTHQSQLKATMDEAHRLGLNVCLYTQHSLSSISPQSSWVAQWSKSIPLVVNFTRDLQNNGVPQQNVYLGYQAKSWADFYLYNSVKLITDYGVNGFYLDGTCLPAVTNNPYADGAFKAGGVSQPVNPIFSTREFMKRWYRACKSADPSFMFEGHISGGEYFMPTVGFLDWMMGGETFWWVGSDYDIPWGYMRAAHSGRQFGVPTKFYCTPKTPEPYIIPMCLLHGTDVYGFFNYGETTRADYALLNAYQFPVWRVWDAFGVNSAQWFPYWKNNASITSSNPDVKVSYYKKSGSVLFVAATNKRQKPTAVITIDLQALGLSSSSLQISAALGAAINVAPDIDGKVRLQFPTQTNDGGYVWLRSD